MKRAQRGQRVLLHDRPEDHRGVEREQRARVVGDQQRPAVGGHVAYPLGLDPPPDVVEELERGIDRLGEPLVEPPLVLAVLAPEPEGDALDRLPQRRSEARRPPAEPRSSGRGRPRSRPASGAGSPPPPRRPGAVEADAFSGSDSARRAWRSPTHPRQPARQVARVQRGADPTAARSWLAKSRTAASASNVGWYPTSARSRRLSTPRPKRRNRTPSPYRGPAPSRLPSRPSAGPNSGCGIGTDGRRARRSRWLSEIDSARRDVDRAADRIPRRRLERAGRRRRREAAEGGGRSRAGWGRPAG